MAHTPRRSDEVAAAYQALLAAVQREAELAREDSRHARGQGASGVSAEDMGRAHWLDAAAEDIQRALDIVEA